MSQREKWGYGLTGLAIGLWLVMYGAWPIGCIVMALTLIAISKKAGASRGSHGTAMWASEAQLKKARMFGKRGWILGRVGKRLVRMAEHLPVHVMVCGPAGSGKLISAIAPNLLTGWMKSAFVFDTKFEILPIVSRWRRKQGHRIVVIDPMGISGQKSYGYNALAHLKPDSPRLIEDSKALASALVPREKTEHDPSWNNLAELVIAFMIGYVVCFGKPETVNLQAVVELLSNEDYFKQTLANAKKNTNVCGGMLGRMANQISQIPDKQKASVMSMCFDHLSFLNSPVIAKFTSCTAKESFNPDWLLAGKCTAFYGLSADLNTPLRGLNRLLITGVLLAFMRAGPSRSRSCALFLDEIFQLGPMRILEDAVVLLRGYGIKTLMAWQSEGQITDIFPGDKARTYQANMDVSMYFKCNDYQTAEAISKRLGETTISVVNRSGGSGSNTSASSGSSQSQSSAGNSENSGWSTQELGRHLLKPDEVMQLPADSLIVFTRNLPPIYAKIVRYYKDREFRRMLPGKFGKRLVAAMVVIGCFVAWVIWNNQ